MRTDAGSPTELRSTLPRSDHSDAQREVGELREEVARLKAERAPEKESETVDG